MERTEWAPANAVEREIADALTAGDGARYAAQLMAAPLFIPALPEPGSQAEREVAQLLPPGAAYVLVYTSAETLAWALGEHVRGYQELDFPALRERWPDPAHQLAVNAGAPIGVFLPPGRVADLADGRQSLVSLMDVQQAVADESLAQIRRACLRELTGEETSAVRRDDPPANDLEAVLREAVRRQESDAFLTALLSAEVVLPTGAPVTDPELIFEEAFPWRVTGAGQAASIPVFSSAELLGRTVAGGTDRVRVPFLDLLASWPDDDYPLCFNPGSVSELILPGGAVRELVATLAELLAAQPAAGEGNGGRPS